MCSAHELNKQGDNIQPWHTPFPIWNQSVVPCPILTVASWPAYRFLRRQVRWSGIPVSLRIFPFVVFPTVKDFGVINKAKVDVFWNSLAFSMIQHMLEIWSLVPLSFLNPPWTTGISQFTYCLSLAWRILSITMLACKMSAIVQLPCLSLDWNENWHFPILWPLLSFPNLLAYWVYHLNKILLGFEIAHWNSSPPPTLFIVMLPEAHVTSHTKMSGSRWVITQS